MNKTPFDTLRQLKMLKLNSMRLHGSAGPGLILLLSCLNLLAFILDQTGANWLLLEDGDLTLSSLSKLLETSIIHTESLEVQLVKSTLITLMILTQLLQLQDMLQ